MQIQIIKPLAIFASYIRYYWVLEADKSDGIVTERVIPNGAIEMMFHYRNPFKCLTSYNCVKKQPQSFLSGISSSYADVSTQGESGMITVTFYPHGACNFFPFPMNETENNDIDLNCLIGREAKIIEQKLYNAASLKERIQIIESFLLKQFSEIHTKDITLLCSAISLINKYQGRLQTIKLADSLGTTTKSLERKFTSLIGKSPKQFSKIIRFKSIIDSVVKDHKNNFAQIALEYGFYDQSHFNKDFKAFSGYTPIEFFRNYPCSSEPII
jgi:AraC-like DNA-binding protein